MARVWVLIETYWNVNNDYGYETREERPVLIETYWNVNNDYRYETREERPVLIETYWNVNFECTQDYQVVTKY